MGLPGSFRSRDLRFKVPSARGWGEGHEKQTWPGKARAGMRSDGGFQGPPGAQHGRNSPQARGDAQSREAGPSSPVMMTSSPSSRNFLVCPSPRSMAFVPLHDSSSRDPKLSGSFVTARGGKPHMYLHLRERVGGRADAWQSRGAPGRDRVLCPSKTLPRWDLCPVPSWHCSEQGQGAQASAHPGGCSE